MDGVWRPVVSGLVGGLVTTGLFFFMRDRVSRSFEGRNVAALIKRYRWHIRFVDTAFLATLIAGVFVYQANWVASNDWRLGVLLFCTGVLGMGIAGYVFGKGY